MKLIIQNNRVAGTATDEYSGPDAFIDAPRGFDATLIDRYTVVDGALLALPQPSVSPRQIRQALTRAGLRASVEAAVAAGDQDTKDWYEFATQFERSSPIVAALGVALSVTSAQLDDLWTLAGTL